MTTKPRTERRLLQVITAMRPQIQEFAIRRGLSTSDADDFAQDVTVRAWQYTSRVDDDSDEIRPLVWRIARGKLVDHFRSRGDPRSTDDGDRRSYVRRATLPLDAAEQLSQLLSRIPAKSRDALLLKYAYDWCNREIAVALDSTESAVRVSNHRWSTRIRELFCETT